MKPVKKILALILAGVMALAMLTGCGKATSPDRAVAESVVDWLKYACSQEGNKNEISVSYQIPELRRDIVPLFDENWITKDNSGKDALTNAAKETLKGILSPYQSAVQISFSAADVTDVKTPFMEITNLNNSQIALIITGSPFEPASVTTIKIAVTHKTVKGRTYALCVAIMEK
jgi:hypothetical protein